VAISVLIIIPLQQNPGIRMSLARQVGENDMVSSSRLLKNAIQSSLPRRRESRKALKYWISAFAGMTAETARTTFS